MIRLFTSRIRRENLRDLDERAAVRARAQEGIARRDTRPWASIDVQPINEAPAPRERPGA